MTIQGAFHPTLSPSSCRALAVSRLALRSSLDSKLFVYCCRLSRDLKALLPRCISTILPHLDNTYTASLSIHNAYPNLSSTPAYHSVSI